MIALYTIHEKRLLGSKIVKGVCCIKWCGYVDGGGQASRACSCWRAYDCTSYILYDVLYMPFHIYTGLRAVDIWNWWVYCILCDELHIVEHICTALTAMDIC